MEGGEWIGQQISRGKGQVELAKQDPGAGCRPVLQNPDNANYQKKEKDRAIGQIRVIMFE